MATNTTARKAPAAKPAAPKPAAPKAETKAADAPATSTTPAEETQAKRGNGDLFSQLAAGATKAEAMPKPTKGNGKPNPLAELVQKSYDDKEPYSLPEIDNDPKIVDGVKAAVRRAAARQGLGVNVTQQTQENGKVKVFLQGKVKDVREN
ncbi:hypothetical protein AB5J62_33635 [Amycolatopsis sp. cg5]|uniref:hypothetical protein n=1 Tax=Amycolatopsis sp. cg5 TaxID=3238802 RepID=UPI003525207C